MKYLVISDIHGSYKYLALALKAYNDFKCDKIICLGDILYHGPRNDLPEEYNPKKCIELLNQKSDIIIAVCGNCDAEVDQMVLNFKIQKPHFIEVNNKKIYLCHGHHLDKVDKRAKIVFYGHTHVSIIEKEDGILYINPGSISIPKGDKIHSFGIIDDSNIMTIYDFDYKEKDKVKL